jgi:hypothetical protein
MKKIKFIITGLVLLTTNLVNSQNTNTPFVQTTGIGIGTTTIPTTLTTPNTPCSLHVVTAGMANLRLERTASSSQNNYLEFFFTSNPATGVTVGAGSSIIRQKDNGASDIVFMHKVDKVGLIIKNDGKVGVGGVTSPTAWLHVEGNYGAMPGMNLPVLSLERKSSSTGSSMGLWTFMLTENTINTAQANLTFTSNQGDVFKLYPNADAKLGGKFTCKEIKVTNTPWADYVFEEDYELMPIDSLEKYIESNNHLPNVPTTEEVTANGNNMAETDKILLEKVEELTLYIIQLEKRLSELEK